MVDQTKEACRIALKFVVQRNFAPGTKEFQKAVQELERRGASEPLVLLENNSSEFDFLKRWLQKISKFLTKF